MSQPKPTPNQAEPTFEVLKRLIDRKADAGRLKYGVTLQPLNGRCSLVDLLEELVDGSKYALNEIRNQRQLLRQLVGWSNDLAAVDNADAKSVGQDIEEMFVQLGGWPAITMYGELLGDFGRSEMVDVPRRYGMTEQVPPAAASKGRQIGVISAYLREQAGLLRECDKTPDGAVIVQWLLADAERLDWESASSPASPTVANDATVRDQILDDVLALLAGAGIPTPERGYKADGGWGLAFSDLKKAFEEVRRLRQANADLREERQRAVELLVWLARNLKACGDYGFADTASEVIDLLGGEAALASYDEVAENATVAPAPDSTTFPDVRTPGRVLRWVVTETGLMRYVDITLTGDAEFEEAARLYELKRKAATPAHISSLHKAVDGPLPEIESITTTEAEEGENDGR